MGWGCGGSSAVASRAGVEDRTRPGLQVPAALLCDL